ncbi:retrovirus-related pol polyprotein from transposon TNT 1-94, partial [Tanacetum coccineum]
MSPPTAIDCKNPIEVWSGKPANYSKLCVFGCPAYYHVSEEKLDPKGKKGIFIGYGDGFKCYRIWSPSERRVIFSRDVTFDKDYLFRVKKDPLELKLEDCVSKKDYFVYALQLAEELESLELATYREAVTSKECDMWIVAMVAHHDLELEHLDVKTAYLYGALEEEIYVSQPKGFIVQGKEVYVYMEEVKKLKILLNTYIDMKDLGAARKITGKEIIRDQKHVKHVFHYLKGTSDVGLIYYGEHEYMVAGYSDLDYVADLNARRSLTGYVFTIGNSVINTEDNHADVFTTEVKYMALTEATTKRNLVE